MSQTQLLTPISVCQTFPIMPRIVIKRDTILDGIETQLAGDTQVLVLEGPEESGKTTALAQFAKRHESKSFALFISSSSRWAHDPNQMRYDLCNQLEVFLHGRELNEVSEANDAFLGTRLSELLRRANRQRSPFYFIVDGLEEIPTEDETTKRMIIDLLPFGLKWFRFVFSGSLEILDLQPRLQAVSRSWFLTNFSIDESLKYFEGLDVPRDHVEEFHRTCRGMPGYLASVRRLLETGVRSADLVAELPSRLPGLFEIEWRKVERDNRVQREILAFTAFERQQHSLATLSSVTKLSDAEISSSLDGLSFIAIDHAKDGKIRFVSESFRRFAAQELEDLRSFVQDRTIEFLSANPETDEAMTLLPMYFKEADRLQDLLEFLSPMNFAKFLDRSPSIKLIRDKAELGIAAARALNRDGDLVRFSLHNATIGELSYSDASRAQVRAFAALGDYDAAMGFALGATRVEDRLHLLAAVARTRREQGLPIGAELKQQIEDLHQTVDYASIGPRVESLAGDLAHTDIELAIQAVDKATQASRDENELDWSLAKLAIQATIPFGMKAGSAAGVRDITSRIKDPLARRLSMEAALLLGRFSAAEAIAEATRLDTTSDRLYVLRQWMMANRTKVDAADVLEYAVRIAVQTTSYSANAAVFRELATCLPYVRDSVRARHLVGVVGTHLGTLEQLGPTEDYIRLLLILARAEQRYDAPAAKNRILDVYLDISDLRDLATRCTCTARFLSTLELIDPEKTLEEKDKLHSMAMDDFQRQLKELLSFTADHYEATKGIVRALTVARPDLAIRIPELLNTENRRNSALVEFVETAAEAPIEQLKPIKILQAVDLITERDKRDAAILQALESIILREGSTPPADLSALLEVAPQLADARKRARACAISLVFLARHPTIGTTRLRESLEGSLQRAWDSTDTSWQKADVGFGVSGDLAADRPDLARHYLDLASSFKHQTPLTDQRAALSAIMSVELAIRAYAGLLPRNLDTIEDQHRLDRVINMIPGAGPQAELWAELALRYHLNDRQARCEEVVTKRIRPLLRALPDNNEEYKASVTVRVAPALYAAFPASCFDTLEQLSVHDRDDALTDICLYLLRQCPPREPFDYVEGSGYSITQETATEVCHILDRFSSDSNIYLLCEQIVDSVLHPREQTSFSRFQKGEIARLLRDIANRKFPVPGQIQHDGYLIATLVQAGRLQSLSSKEWDSLVERARLVGNSADTAYLLSVMLHSTVTQPNGEGLFRRRRESRRQYPLCSTRSIISDNSVR